MLQESEINLGTGNLELEETASEEPFFSKTNAAKGAVIGSIIGAIIETAFIASGYLEQRSLEVSTEQKVQGVVLFQSYLGL